MEYSRHQTLIVGLHGHWITADALDYHLRRSLGIVKPNELPEGVDPEFAAFSMALSVTRVLGVLYSLLYVLVEGYKEIGVSDAPLDRLLASENYLDQLRRFRNATFHFQPEAIPAKVYDFLSAPDSEKWIGELRAALKSFVEKQVFSDPHLARIVAESGIKESSQRIVTG